VRLHKTQQELLAWYRKKGRRFPWRKKRLSCYQRIVTEILLQRTKAETVAKFYIPFMEAFPGWRQLSLTPDNDLQHALKPIGLWRRRAEVLKKLSSEMKTRNGRFPERRDVIETLPGVGQYVANAIELFCHGKPRPLLDSNMARVFERVYGPRKLADIRYDQYLQELAQDFITCDFPIALNWAVLDLAALVCRIKSPICNGCPFKNTCKKATISM